MQIGTTQNSGASRIPARVGWCGSSFGERMEERARIGIGIR